MNTEKKDLKRPTDIDHSFTFNSKVFNTVDDFLFNKETAKSGWKRKRESENIVGTKKSKKRLEKTIKLECNQTAKYFTCSKINNYNLYSYQVTMKDKEAADILKDFNENTILVLSIPHNTNHFFLLDIIIITMVE